MFQRSSFKRNIILLEITQLNKILAQLNFYLLLANILLEKNISEMKLYLPNNCHWFLLHPSSKFLLHGSLWFKFTTRTTETISKFCFAALLCRATIHFLKFHYLHVPCIIFNFWNTVYEFRFCHFYDETCFAFKIICFEFFEFTWFSWYFFKVMIAWSRFWEIKFHPGEAAQSSHFPPSPKHLRQSVYNFFQFL